MTTYVIFPDKAEFESRVAKEGWDPEAEYVQQGDFVMSVIGERRDFAGYAEDETPIFDPIPGWHVICLGELPYGWKQFVSDQIPPRTFGDTP